MMDESQRGDWRTVGNEFAVKQLQGAIRSDRIAHAYLFTGPERVGKRTLALDLARALCCELGRDVSTLAAAPCGTCSPCDRLDRQLHPDVRVMSVNTPTSKDNDAEAAAKRISIPIDLIRDLQSESMLEPYESSYRVFLIDGAHMLAAEAANALLKTLEEPPRAVRLLLTAPSQSQLPLTIVSRCHVIKMRPVPTDAIADALVSRYRASEEEARNLAVMSGCNPGWAITALEDPSLIDDARETASRIMTILASSLEQRFNYASDMVGEYRRDRMAVVNELTRWTQVVRDLALVKHGLGNHVAASHDEQRLEDLAGQMSDHDVAQALSVAERTRDAINANVLPQLAFEVMMLEMPSLAG